jgi:AAA+ ATPase superfamily predicted ATPase
MTDTNNKLVLFEEKINTIKNWLIQIEYNLAEIREDFENTTESLEQIINEKCNDVKSDIIDGIIDKLKTIN